MPAAGSATFAHTACVVLQIPATPRRHTRPGADVDPDELEQFTRNLAMAPILDERDRQVVIDAVRRLADLERAKRRHPGWRAVMTCTSYAHSTVNQREPVSRTEQGKHQRVGGHGASSL